MEEVGRIELPSKRLPRKALQLVETITPPKGEGLFPRSLNSLSFTSDSALLKETVSDRAEGWEGGLLFSTGSP